MRRNAFAALKEFLLALLFCGWTHGSAPTFASWNIVAVGDSLTCSQADCSAGFGVPETYFDLYVGSTNPAVFAHSNLAVAGSTPAQICTVSAAQTPVGGKKNIMVYMTIGNGQNNAATFTTGLATCLDAARTAGWYVVAVTLQNQTSKVSFVDTASATIRGWGNGLHYDTLVDLNLDPLLGCDTCATNATLFNADEVHFVQAGQNRFNTVVFTPVMNAIH